MVDIIVVDRPINWERDEPWITDAKSVEIIRILNAGGEVHCFPPGYRPPFGHEAIAA
jgi:hypothetical protein